MTLAHRLRRLLHRPPTIEDCLRAAGMAPCEPMRAPENPHSEGEVWGSGEDSRCPVRCRQPVCPHVDRPIVNGPGLVERTKAAHAAHIARYGDDAGWMEIEWGTFVENHLGHDAVEEA